MLHVLMLYVGTWALAHLLLSAAETAVIWIGGGFRKGVEWNPGLIMGVIVVLVLMALALALASGLVHLTVVAVLRKVRPGATSTLTFTLGSAVTLALLGLVSYGPLRGLLWVQVGPEAYVSSLVAGWTTQRIALDHPEQFVESS